MTEAQTVGWKNLWCDATGVRIANGSLQVSAVPLVRFCARSADGFVFGESETHTLGYFDQVMVRIDPPMNMGYIQAVQLLDVGRSVEPRKNVAFTNPLEALIASTSKLEALRLPGSHPPTLVARDWDSLAEFGLRFRRTILKPLNSCNSDGVQRLDWSTSSGKKHARHVIELLSDQFAIAVQLQHDLGPSAADEVRLWMLDGDVLASAARVFEGDARKISSLRTTALSKSQCETLAVLRRHLLVRGIRLAAVDMIGDAIIDMNFASPGLLVELEEFTGTNLAGEVIQALTP
jgi:glutathione synthase